MYDFYAIAWPRTEKCSSCIVKFNHFLCLWALSTFAMKNRMIVYILTLCIHVYTIMKGFVMWTYCNSHIYSTVSSPCHVSITLSKQTKQPHSHTHIPYIYLFVERTMCLHMIILHVHCMEVEDIKAIYLH